MLEYYIYMLFLFYCDRALEGRYGHPDVERHQPCHRAMVDARRNLGNLHVCFADLNDHRFRLSTNVS